MVIRASDAERDATVHRLREAATEGRLTLEEFSNRIEVAVSAVMRSELVPLTSDLPAPGPTVAHASGPAPVSVPPPAAAPATAAAGVAAPLLEVRAAGDIKRSGPWTVPAETSFRTWFGSIRLDLRQAQISATETRIHARAVFGNVDLLVPKGVEVDVQARTQLGQTNLKAGSGRPGAPRIVLTGGSVFGNVNVLHPRLWQSLGRRGRPTR